MKNKFFKIFLIVLLVVVAIVGFNKHNFKDNAKNKVSIEKWDNFYNEDNIQFYYQDPNDINIQQVESNYKIKELIKGTSEDFEKAIKIMDWLGGKLKYTKGSMKSEGYAMDIINESKESGKTINDDDYCSVYMEMVAAAGLKVRKGEFRVKDSYKNNKVFNHFVCEIWSDKYNKWIMIDPSNGHYITYNNAPLSAGEIIKNGLNNIQVAGGTNAKKYIKDIERYFYSYTIPIDNSIYGVKKSNSYITYLNEGQIPEIYIKDSLIPPTIFTNNDKLFKISPRSKYKNYNSDNLSTLIFSQKKSGNDKDKDKNKIQLYCGVFKNSVMEEKYFISINDGTWKEVNKYFDFPLVTGKNSIKLSMDKNKVQREVIINYLDNNKK